MNGSRRTLILLAIAAGLVLLAGPMLLVLSYAVPAQYWMALIGFGVVVLLLREMIKIRGQPEERRRLLLLGGSLLASMGFVVYMLATAPI